MTSLSNERLQGYSTTSVQPYWNAVAILAVTKETLCFTSAGDTLLRTGEEIALLAFVMGEEDGNPGEIERASSVIFEIWNSDGKVLEITAQITQTSPGYAIAEALTEPLPPDLYTVKVRLGGNPYYQAGETSSELAVYDPEGGHVYGAGLLSGDGLRLFSFQVRYTRRNPQVPTGNLHFMDHGVRRNPVRITATSFTYLVIPVEEDKAYVTGSCTFNGQRGYSFFLEIEDRDRRLLKSMDWLRIIVRDSAGDIVYQAEGLVRAGLIEVYRRRERDH